MDRVDYCMASLAISFVKQIIEWPLLRVSPVPMSSRHIRLVRSRYCKLEPNGTGKHGISWCCYRSRSRVVLRSRKLTQKCLHVNLVVHITENGTGLTIMIRLRTHFLPNNT